MNPNRSNQLPISENLYRELALKNALLREAAMRQPPPAARPAHVPTMDIHRQLQYLAALNGQQEQQAHIELDSVIKAYRGERMQPSTLRSSILDRNLQQPSTLRSSILDRNLQQLLPGVLLQPGGVHHHHRHRHQQQQQQQQLASVLQRRSIWPPASPDTQMLDRSPKRPRLTAPRRFSTFGEFPLPGALKEGKDAKKKEPQFSSFRQLWSGIEGMPGCTDKMKEELFLRQLQSGKLVTGGTSRSALQSAKAQEVHTKRRYSLRK
jgi:hypothetical protein